MKICYELTTTDTLFLRGAEPLEAGQPSGEALFPPPVSVLQGAVRTAVLRQRGIAFADYKAGRCPQEILERIGHCGQPAPFHITAVLMRREGTLYAPCPASWFVDKAENMDGHANRNTPCAARPFSPLGRTLLQAALPPKKASSLLPHSSAGTALPMVRAKDAKPLAAYWVRLECLRRPPVTFAAGDLLTKSELYDTESRTGIAIDSKRKVQEGKIYTAAHIRLRPEVTLLIGLDSDPGLQKKGRLFLGGEQRICGYATAAAPALPQGEAALYLALAPLELTVEILPHVFAASKPVTLAGWDLARGFHKATTAWLPAGSVFTKRINPCCIPLPQGEHHER